MLPVERRSEIVPPLQLGKIVNILQVKKAQNHLPHDTEIQSALVSKRSTLLSFKLVAVHFWILESGDAT